MKNYFWVLVLLGCTSPTDELQLLDTFNTVPTQAAIKPNLIDEASGMVDSRTFAKSVWIIQDSGNPPELALLNHNGNVTGKINLPELQNRDWEDLTSGVIDGQNFLFIAEIGDNDARHELSFIYKLPEPKSLNERPTNIERISFKYPDGPRDAETLLFDPRTKDLLIVSKRESSVRIYRLAFPQATDRTLTAELIGTLPHTFMTAGCIGADGSEIVLKNYSTVFYWPRGSTESLADALKKKATKLPYLVEPQGESVCFARDNGGYFTVSERANAAAVSLNFYGRK